MSECSTDEKMVETVITSLEKLSELVNAQLWAFARGSDANALFLDKDLEQAEVERERAIGALLQHRREHHCSPVHEVPPVHI